MGIKIYMAIVGHGGKEKKLTQEEIKGYEQLKKSWVKLGFYGLLGD